MNRAADSMRTWKLLLITDMPEMQEEIAVQLNGLNVFMDAATLDEAQSEVFRTSPDLMLLHESRAEVGPETVEFVLRESPKSTVIYLAETRDFVTLREVIRAGAEDVLVIPEEAAMIGDVLRRVLRRREEADRSQSASEIAAGTAFSQGRVITVYGAKGGCGKTLVATTLAQTLQLDYPYSVLLIDLNFRFGGVEAVLGLEKDPAYQQRRSFYDLLPVIEELNEAYLLNVTLRLSPSQLDILLSPADAEKAERIRPEHVRRLLRVARRYYDYILVDMPGGIDENVFTALQESDRILYVLTPEVPALRAFRRALDLMRRLSVDTRPDRLGVIFNRVHRRNEVSVRDLEKLEEIHLVGTIQEDSRRIQSAYNLGVPLRRTPKERRVSLFARNVRKIAKALVDSTPSLRSKEEVTKQQETERDQEAGRRDMRSTKRTGEEIQNV